MGYYHIDWKQVNEMRRANDARRLGLTPQQYEDYLEACEEYANAPKPLPRYKTENGVDMILTDSGEYEQITD